MRSGIIGALSGAPGKARTRKILNLGATQAATFGTVAASKAYVSTVESPMGTSLKLYSGNVNAGWAVEAYSWSLIPSSDASMNVGSDTYRPNNVFAVNLWTGSAIATTAFQAPTYKWNDYNTASFDSFGSGRLVVQSACGMDVKRDPWAPSTVLRIGYEYGCAGGGFIECAMYSAGTPISTPFAVAQDGSIYTTGSVFFNNPESTLNYLNTYGSCAGYVTLAWGTGSFYVSGLSYNAIVLLSRKTAMSPGDLSYSVDPMSGTVTVYSGNALDDGVISYHVINLNP